MGEVFEEYVEKNHPELPALTIIQGGGTVKRDEADRNILYDKDSLTGYKLVKKDDFILHLRSFEGGLERATCDGIISPAYHTFHGAEIDPRFYYVFFRSCNFIKRKLVPHIYGIRDGKSIDVEGMKGIEIPYPSIQEQKRIGGYIEALDTLITLHQCKCAIFSINEVFDWEQRKLGEMVQFSKGSGYSKADLKDSGTPIILYGRLYTKYETVISDVDTFADEKAGAVYSHGGEVIVPASGETAEDISIASVVEKSGILLGGDLNIITPSSNLDSAFLAISISSGKPHGDMAKMAQGKSVVHLHNTDLEKIELLYPNYVEQIQISSYFKSLDILITLHQCRQVFLKINRIFT